MFKRFPMCAPWRLLALAAVAALQPHLCRGGELDETPGIAWSTDAASDTPEFDRKFRGEFSNQDVVARLEKLPEHEYLQISAQLFILRSWDGMARSNDGRSHVGPDFIRVGLDDGRTLVHAVFSNTPVYPGFNPEAAWQTYPSPMPGDRSPYMTGADLKNALGYFFVSNPHPPQPLRQDAVYTLKMNVPHTADKVAIHFRGMGLQGIGDESWGLADLKITTLARSATQIPVADAPVLMLDAPDGMKMIVQMLDAAAAAKLLAAADGHDAMAANTAFWRLVAGRDATAEYLAKNVKPRTVDAAKVKALVSEIYDNAPPKDEKDVRVRNLLALGATVEPLVRDLRDESAEDPSRLDWALMEISAGAVEDAGLREWMIATRVLEVIGTPRAKQVRMALCGVAEK